ncbi:tRNA methyltransferase PPM2 [Aspergillus lucknowensis]|uniref:tRNA wybutosine-synthesizing protein 4 n=1 Tax=Aspergillus lucknowensis TaxID=176173 RepID=A0ABR4LJF4_9EURO
MAPSKPPAKAGVVSKEEKAADSVMGTNNSSIVSKRSVEMLYYPEPHFFRYFVKKPQRRAPLVNREYWLRMHVISETVKRFMREPSDKPKFVLNLGCGFDALPFILLRTDRPLCSCTTFVDIDYEKLMVDKRAAIQKTEVITELLKNVEFGADESAVQIRSKEYIAVGCDLKKLEKLDNVLKTQVLPDECAILFVAEVSLTYMDVKSANAVLCWASKLRNDSQFCILEQLFPDGPNHPLASTVMKHYGKLGAPLFSVHEYPSLGEQEQRFKDAGWEHAHARSLWDLWLDNEFVDSSRRASLDTIELFDEWEEFALFESHYFLLHASMSQGPSGYMTACAGVPGHLTDKSDQFKLIPNCTPPTSQRRFGALVPASGGVVGYHSGLGRQTRLPDTDLYTRSKEATGSHVLFPPRDVSARMCHSITSFNDSGDCLLVGGRASPASAFQDCWVRKDHVWRVSSSLPVARFRHSATRVTLGSDSILIYGGKTSDGSILDSWLIWSDNNGGWQAVGTEITSPTPKARFGACLGNVDGTSGVLFGGMGLDGTILEDFWTWRLHQRGDGSLYLHLRDQTESIRKVSPGNDYLARFGATIVSTSWGLVIAGGIIPRRVVPRDHELLLLDSKELLKCIESGTSISTPVLSRIGLGLSFSGPRPLLVGHTSIAVAPDQVLFIGGGAVCFPSGIFWSEGTWILSRADSPVENHWTLVPERVRPAKTEVTKLAKHTQADKSTSEVTPIPRLKIQDAAQFHQVMADGQPVIIEGSDIGPCTELWSKEYLINRVGSDRNVVVHEAESENMSFQTKNFAYRTKPFGTFIDEIHAGGRQYLRSISSTQPTKLPATLAVDFPKLKDDFRLPEALSTVVENAHSSPLRISGPVTLWLHYDVMANVLCQVKGEKRLILFPPSDVQHLDVPAGASSSNINIFQSRGDGSIASIPHTSPHEALLKSSDILFIPPLWLHTAAPTGDVSIAVNVFFRSLSQGYAAGRDVYGNRDLQAYEKSRSDLAKIAKSFNGLPPDMARFYLVRLANELREMAEG